MPLFFLPRNADQLAQSGRSLLVGPLLWSDELAAITLEYGVTGSILTTVDAPSIELFAAGYVGRRTSKP